MEFTLRGAVKLNRVTGFSKAADNLLVIKNPSGCAGCLRWSLSLVPGRKNLVNTPHGHGQRLQMVETHRAGSGPLQLLLAFSILAVLLLRNFDGFGVFFSTQNGFWKPKLLVLSTKDRLALSEATVCWKLWLAWCVFSLALPLVLILKHAHGSCPGMGDKIKVFPCEDCLNNRQMPAVRVSDHPCSPVTLTAEEQVTE